MQKAFVKYTLILGFLRGEALLLPYAKSFCKIYFDFGIFKGRSPLMNGGETPFDRQINFKKYP
ncbi:hypothetical protein X929_01710 [Petrotoga olearia DSM 13574]|uniref:Uncharacterized protein n=1 Tax=Petrotoga olearia DSM 13574 TaxID=1122955 RepID=A0A2K1P5S9_9BACT|nr:hypothetical protein X929_01710 [Petrotoga olearia DSM 13574]